MLTGGLKNQNARWLFIALGFALLRLLAAPAFAQTPDAPSPRVALHQLGVEWTPDAFNQALLHKDYDALELFFKGGFKVPDKFAVMINRPYLVFLISELSTNGLLVNDQRTVDLLVKYHAFEGVETCGIDLTYPNISVTFVKDAETTPAATSIARAFCNKPEVLAKVQERIDDAKAHRQLQDYRLWSREKAFLTAKS
jgi:hypothetical protein